MSEEHNNAERGRQQMIEAQLRRRGLRDERVLAAMSRVPRELFVPPTVVAAAYDDRALEIGWGQTISQPYIVAYMTEQLAPRETDRILEIGSGSGYQTAILASLSHEVFTVEALVQLSRETQVRLRQLGHENVQYRIGDGTLGWSAEAPFDGVIVTAGAPQIPPPLLEQLRPGGRMILPVGNERTQRLVLVERREDRFIERPLIGCRFVKLLGQHGWPCC